MLPLLRVLTFSKEVGSRRFSSSASRLASTQTRVLISTSNDPFFNLATEDWLFREGDWTKQTLYLWKNEPTVVIGRNQNPWKECDVELLTKDGIHLCRRTSGGGAVYHDLGNTCFSFFSPKPIYDKNKNSEIICKAIKQFNIIAKPNERNDILVDNHKISGAAYKLSGQKALHHGTLLINANLDNLQRYLFVSKGNIKSKGVDSVRSKVANLKEYNPDVTHEALSKAIIEEFWNFYGQDCPVEELNVNELSHIPHLKKMYEELRDWKWKFGETPFFEHQFQKQFDWGLVDIHISSKDGLITDVKISSDSLLSAIVHTLTHNLKGATYDKMGFVTALDHARKALEIHSLEHQGSTEESEAANQLMQLEQWILSVL